MNEKNRSKSFFWFHFLLSSYLLANCLSSTFGSEFGFHFTRSPEWQIVAPGQEVHLHCTTNLPPEKVRWLHNHGFIPPEEAKKQPLFNETSINSLLQKRTRIGSQLLLKISTDPTEYKIQEGLYQCVSSIWALAVTSLPGQIRVGYLRPFPTLKISNNTLKVEVGSSFKIPCQRPDSLPKAKLYFYKDGKYLNVLNNKKFFLTDEGDLVVVKAKFSSKGVYWCSARNEVLGLTVSNGFKTSVVVRKRNKSAPLTIVPRLMTFDSIIKRLEGENLSLMCLVVQGHADGLHWSFKNKRPLQTQPTDKSVSIVIKNVTNQDAGKYRCQGENAFGLSLSDVVVEVEERPFLLTGPQGLAVVEGSNITLSCEFGGTPIPTVAWVFLGNLLNSKDNILVKGERLYISSIRLKQAGVYQCFGFNPYGAAQGSAIVTTIPRTVRPNSTEEEDFDLARSSLPDETKVKNNMRKRKNGKRRNNRKKNNEGRMRSPSKPNVTKISDESVMVTWDINANNSIPIEFFKIQYKIAKRKRTDDYNSQKWRTLDEDIASHVRSFEVIGLETGRIYRFRVAVIYINNDSRLGSSSKKFLLVKSDVLQPPEKAPKIVSISPKRNSSLIIHWISEALAETEGFIIYYRDSPSAVDYTKITLLGKEKRSYVIQHLDPHSPYEFKMCSFNLAGRSNFSVVHFYIPEGLHIEKKSETEVVEPLIPVVISETDELPEGLLFASLGIGLATLFSIVIISFTCYSCKHKNDLGEEIVDSKFMDTSLRIHHQSKSNIEVDLQPSSSELLLGTQTSIENNLNQFSYNDSNIPLRNSNI